jgi:hypothetical protein
MPYQRLLLWISGGNLTKTDVSGKRLARSVQQEAFSEERLAMNV